MYLNALSSGTETIFESIRRIRRLALFVVGVALLEKVYHRVVGFEVSKTHVRPSSLS